MSIDPDADGMKLKVTDRSAALYQQQNRQNFTLFLFCYLYILKHAKSTQNKKQSSQFLYRKIKKVNIYLVPYPIHHILYSLVDIAIKKPMDIYQVTNYVAYFVHIISPTKIEWVGKIQVVYRRGYFNFHKFQNIKLREKLSLQHTTGC